MAFLCQYILNINCLWKFLSKIVLFIAYLGFLLSQTVSIPIFSSRTGFATLTPCLRVTVGHPWVTIGHFRATMGHLRLTIGYLKAIVVHIRVIFGHLKVTIFFYQQT